MRHCCDLTPSGLQARWIVGSSSTRDMHDAYISLQGSKRNDAHLREALYVKGYRVLTALISLEFKVSQPCATTY
jgi:hypothetical protein